MIDNFNSNVNPEKQDYKKITPFKMFIKGYFPFIEDTMEAVDNYGLLCKVVEYLNNLIENENTTVDNINALYQAFTDLKNEVETYINTEVLPELNEKIEYIDNYFENLNVQEEVNVKIDELMIDGTIPNMIENLVQGQLNDLTEEIESQNNQIESQNNQILLLGNRIDEIANLPSGSTSGDAELVDIRIGYNGIKYQSAGTSVRKQVKNLNDKLTYISEEPVYPNLLDETSLVINKYMDTEGNIQTSSTFSYTDFIPVEEGETYYLSAFRPTLNKYALIDARFLTAFNSSYEPISNSGVAYLSGVYTVPNGISYVVLTIQTSYFSAFSDLYFGKGDAGYNRDNKPQFNEIKLKISDEEIENAVNKTYTLNNQSILEALKYCYNNGFKKLIVPAGTYDIINEYESYFRK